VPLSCSSTQPFSIAQAGLVFRRRTLELIEEGLVDLLDIDPAVLDWLEGVG
jgi:hypothetical protein